MDNGGQQTIFDNGQWGTMDNGGQLTLVKIDNDGQWKILDN